MRAGRRLHSEPDQFTWEVFKLRELIKQVAVECVQSFLR